MTAEHMTRREVADELRCCTRTVYNYWKKGWLPQSRMGRHIVYKREDVHRLIEAGVRYDARVLDSKREGSN